MVSLSAMETTFMGRVMCPGDREENRECLLVLTLKPSVVS